MVQATISLRYQLQLHEFEESFKIASFGQKGIMAWVTTILATGLIFWGFKLGFDGAGKYYIILGAVFSIMQLLIRFVFVPKIFQRQFQKTRLDELQQGIDLYQNEFVLLMGDRQKTYAYNDVQKAAEGKICYVLELKNRVAIIVPKRAFKDEAEQQLFKSQFKV